MTESQIQRKILTYLKNKGFAVKLSDRWQSGLPDILFIRDGVTYFFEVKTPKGVVSEIQKYTMKKLNEAGAIALVVRSLDDVKEVIRG